MAAIPKKQTSKISKTNYQKFSLINGDHPFKEETSFSYVEYEAKKRPNGSVRYFNYRLAKEMGLINHSHPEKMNSKLEKILLDTFAITIINEYDIQNNVKIPKSQRLDRKYMATRYLQLQNPNKQGVYSGDGRSIWNGVHKHKNMMWDITSCGTGATCLSPATKIHNRFFQTGDPFISYGCGYSTFHEGIVDVVFSEMFAQKKIKTERVLCVITFPDGYSIKVRVGENLLRPSHMFAPLRQQKRDRLREIVDYYIKRETMNGSFSKSTQKNQYKAFLKKFSEEFAEIAAVFEQEYIFCWLDWDGDNIMANGGLIDFGSIRQLGVFHHEYKFDDDGNWSTNIKEQLSKARNTVKAMAQAVDYILTGKKKPLESYSRSKAVKDFDNHYIKRKHYHFAKRLGISDFHSLKLSERPIKAFKELLKAFENLERRKANKEFEPTPDGKNIPILFNMRRFTRTMLSDGLKTDDVAHMLEKSLTNSAVNQEKTFTVNDINNAKVVMNSFAKIIRKFSLSLKCINDRSQLFNQDNRVTGDSVCLIAEYLKKKSKDLSSDELYKVVELYLKRQKNGRNLNVQFFDLSPKENKKIISIGRHIEKLLLNYSESL